MIFKKDDVIIPRCDGLYPDDAHRVVSDDGETIVAYPIFGGFQHRLRDRNWRIASEQDRVPRWRKVFVSFDDCPEWPAWWSGERWNGWAVPLFEKHVAELVLRLFASDADYGYDSRFDERADAFIVTDRQERGEVQLLGQGIATPDGNVVRVYRFDNGWCFNQRDVDSAPEWNGERCGWCYERFERGVLGVRPEFGVLCCSECSRKEGLIL